MLATGREGKAKVEKDALTKVSIALLAGSVDA